MLPATHLRREFLLCERHRRSIDAIQPWIADPAVARAGGEVEEGRPRCSSAGRACKQSRISVHFPPSRRPGADSSAATGVEEFIEPRTPLRRRQPAVKSGGKSVLSCSSSGAVAFRQRRALSAHGAAWASRLMASARPAPRCSRSPGSRRWSAPASSRTTSACTPSTPTAG